MEAEKISKRRFTPKMWAFFGGLPLMEKENLIARKLPLKMMFIILKLILSLPCLLTRGLQRLNLVGRVKWEALLVKDKPLILIL